MLARWRPCSTTSGELYRRYCANKKENAGRVANYLRTMGTIWRPLSRPKVMMMGQIAYLDAYGGFPHPAEPKGMPGIRHLDDDRLNHRHVQSRGHPIVQETAVGE